MESKIVKFAKKLFKTTKNKGNKNKFLCKNTGFITCKFKLNGKNNIVEADDSLFFKCKFFISGSNNKIIIGKKCLFKNVEFWIEGDNNSIIIGDNCSFCGKTQIACLESTTIKIGNNILSSSDVFLRTSDSHSICDMDGKRINYARDIIIGNNVWICQKSSILKGVAIPNNCVVAYGSIVTKSFFEENCIIGGCPSSVIKRNIQWKAQR